VSSPDTFGCGHPRAGNTIASGALRKDGTRVPMCAFCSRVRNIVRQVKRDQERINAGTFYTLGQRIARDIADG
jgi:hypothetical protein